MDHRVVELIGRDLAFEADDHVADHRESIDLRHQGAEAVRDLLGQHRDHATREVHRCAALESITVERGTHADVVAHVGDRDQQSPALLATFERLAIDRVVEVACVFTVDGHERHVGEIDATGLVDRTDGVGQCQRLGFGGRREDVRDVVLADRDLDLHARIVDLAEHFVDASDRLRVARRLLDDLDGDDLTGLRLSDFARRDQDVVLDALVFGNDDEDTAFAEQPTDQSLGAALGDFDDRAFWLAAVVGPGRLDQHAVTVQDLEHLLRREPDVGAAAIVADQEAVAVAMTHDAPGDEVELVGQQEDALAIGHQLPVAFHRGEATIEARHLFGRDVEPGRQLRGHQRHVAGAQLAQDRLALGDLIFEPWRRFIARALRLGRPGRTRRPGSRCRDCNRLGRRGRWRDHLDGRIDR